MKHNYKINNEIYSDNIIKQAIIDFEEVCNIEYIDNILIIESDNSEEIFNEFMNYTIWLINE